MPLFNCTSCAAIENTALSKYWTDLYRRDKSVPFNPLCSKCDPRIGKWHGNFERTFEPVADSSLAQGAPRLLNTMRSSTPPEPPALDVADRTEDGR
jgi:hypothetical protein